ncbi:hypothetical protein BOX15_Mlig010493g10, partial [Macrostomum lignano]
VKQALKMYQKKKNQQHKPENMGKRKETSIKKTDPEPKEYDFDSNSDADSDEAPPTAVSFGAARQLAIDSAAKQREQLAVGNNAKQVMRARRRDRQESNRLMKKPKPITIQPPSDDEADFIGSFKRKPADPLPDFIPIRSDSVNRAKPPRPLVAQSSDGSVQYIRDPGQVYLASKCSTAQAFRQDRFNGRCGVRRSAGGRDGAQAYVKLHDKLRTVKRLARTTASSSSRV